MVGVLSSRKWDRPEYDFSFCRIADYRFLNQRNGRFDFHLFRIVLRFIDFGRSQVDLIFILESGVLESGDSHFAMIGSFDLIYIRGYPIV